MSSNRIVAAAFVALLAVQVFPAPASAQLTGQPDLVVESVDVGRIRVALVEAPINITVRNIGNANFGGTPGWQIFVGLGGSQPVHCIEPGENPVNPQPSPGTSPCYKVITPGNQNGESVNIPAGEARTYSFMWNAERAQANNSGIIYTQILGLGGTAGSQSETCVEGTNTEPGEGVCSNNLRSRSGVFIGEPGVRAVPQRQPSPSAESGNTNSAWKQAEIEAPCPVAPSVLNMGCKVRAGRSIAATYLLRNVGTVDDTYTPSLSDGVDDLRNLGYTFSFAPDRFSLGAGQQREVQLTIFVPENATALSEINVGQVLHTARWVSSLAPTGTYDGSNPGCVPADVNIYCRDPSLPSFIVDHRRAYNVTANYTFDDVGLGETSIYKLNITNEGNADDEFNVTLLVNSRTINGSWSATLATPGGTVPNSPDSRKYPIDKGANRTIDIQVSPPLNATNGTYWFDVAIRSMGDDDGTAPCKRFEMTVLLTTEGECRVRFYVHVRQSWLITGFNDVAERVVPGETAVYELGIDNGGNGYDNITLDLQTTVFGWDVRLSNRTLALRPDNITPFTLTVTSPPNTPENTIGAFYVNATSSGPLETPADLRSKASIESIMTIIRGPNIRIDAPINNSFVDSGATVDYTLLISNTGNVADNFTLPTPERPSDWGVTVVPAYLELQPNQQGSVVVSLRAPAAAEVGEKATAIVKVKSTVDPSRERSTNLEARVSGPDLFVDNVLVNSSNPYTGDPLEVSVVLGNSGNKAHENNATLRVYFVQNGVERVIGERVYPALFIGGQRRLTETFPWDTAGVEGSGVILARIDAADNVPEIDDSAASNERTRAVTLRTFDIKLTPAEGLSARPGESLTYSEAPNAFTLRYEGNQESEPVLVRVVSEHGWLASAEEISLSLPRGASVLVQPSLNIPALPGAATDTLTLVVSPIFRPEEVLRVSTTTTVIDEEKPIVRSITATPADARLGDTIVIVVEVEDATGVSSATAYVTFPTNETSAVALTKTGPTTFRGERAFTVAGPYRIAAELEDSADPPNVNNTRVFLGSFIVTPGSAPTIELAAGQATTIRTGSPIDLDIRDPLGIGDASYNIKGVSYDLRAPGYQIDTSTLQAGTVEINVTAENIYGVSTSRTFTFVVDNSPPNINRVSLNPERPRANQDVTVTVQTEAQVEAVDILVKRDGQVVQTLNATKRGVGSFAATFNPGEGDYTLDVTARDAAGNTKLQDGAVEFSARAGSPFTPGPGAWMVLLAVAGLALLMHRRR